MKTPHALSAAAYASSGLVQLKKHVPGVAYNAIYLEGVKGTVLQADLQSALNPILHPSQLTFILKVRTAVSRVDCQWINDGKDVVLYPATTPLPFEEIESALHSVMKPVRHYISSSSVAIGAELCWINREGQVSYRESTRQLNKAIQSAPVPPWNKPMAPKFESSNVYDALSGVGASASSATVNSVTAKKERRSRPS